MLFFFGAMSPYSWFTAERIGDLIPDAKWRPVFAGGLFSANERSSWGLDSRRAGGVVDCERRAAHHGLGTIHWPKAWPTSDILIARAMAFSERRGLLVEFALAAMRTAFVEGSELGDLAVVQRVGQLVGLDPGELVLAVAEPSIKDQVRAVHDPSHWAFSEFPPWLSATSTSGAMTASSMLRRPHVHAATRLTRGILRATAGLDRPPAPVPGRPLT